MFKKTFYLALVLGTVLAGCNMQPGPGNGGGSTGGEAEGNLSFSRDLVIFNAGGGIASDSRTVEITNTGTVPLELSAAFTGDDAAQFTLQDGTPFSLAAGASRELTIIFTPATGDFGPQQASLSLTSGGSTVDVALSGLHVVGQDGNIEPSLQWIFDTYGFGISTGDDDPTTSRLVPAPTEELLGDEVPAQTFVRADPTQPVTLQVLAAFGPSDLDPVFAFGFYDPSSDDPELNELLTVPNVPDFNGQRLEPVVIAADGFTASAEGVVSFEPTVEPFGFYSTWPETPLFDERTVYSEDARNTFDSTMHHVRVYPVTNNTYLIVTDESNGLNDFNDSVVLATNIQPVAATAEQ